MEKDFNRELSEKSMIPLKDEIPTRSFPIVNLLLIVANIAVFGLQWLAGPYQTELVYRFAVIPIEVTSGYNVFAIGNIFSSMFMHAGLMHLGGNMLYLWIFGDNVEDSMGHFKYLLFYLVGGIVAALTHILTNPSSAIPTVGASGAIAAVLGAYLILYPKSRVLTVIPLGIFFKMTMVPSVIVLGLWFVIQLVSGMLSMDGPDVGGVAFWAHIGGFVAGMAMAKLFSSRRKAEAYLPW
jgi:membrane associated rhomboid family serine protease